MAAVKQSWQDASEEMTPRERALCTYAEKLTRTPHQMTQQDLEPLRGAGLGDGEILEVVHIIGYFNHINRVADALDVDPESWMNSDK